MCGINGYLKKAFIENNSLLDKLSTMNKCILHRGPDEDGFFSDASDSFSMGMAMQRLSIIDLSTGKQPIFSKDKQIVIVFNGEIYNYISLKEQLIKEGCEFETNSDTEVILKLYEKHGIDSFSKLDGMFAFSIFDKRQGKVFIARDFFGEKPLYYYNDTTGFYYASELKSIISVLDSKPEISKEGLNLFFQLTYIPAPFTIYQNIHKLEANHYIAFDCNSFNFSIHEIKQSFEKHELTTKKQAVIKTKELVYNSVLSRSISDVPLGTFLSGGVDSSIVSLCLSQQKSSPIDTFSIGFEKKSFDETDKSREVAKLIGSNHHEFIVGEKDLSQNLSEIILNFDEPFADSSALASYVVALKTKQHVKVALTGDGGDEVFGGYNKYYIGKLNQKYTQLMPKKAHNIVSSSFQKLLTTKDDDRGLRFKLKRLINAVNYEGDFYYNIISLGFQENELQHLLIENCKDSNGFSYFKDNIGTNNTTITDFRNIDKLISLEGDMLVKVDRTSMLTSLECRAPFLNKEIWNFTGQLPENYLIHQWDKKHILKEAFREEFSKKFLDKSKKGFGVPVGDWLRTDLKNELESYIDTNFLQKQHIFNLNTVIPLVKDHLSGKRDNTFKVWSFYCFQKWFIQIYEA
tara:strand:- start:11735 stop:13627 length:1893 start_codon:yes stop_codon:yes gene_type:complete